MRKPFYRKQTQQWYVWHKGKQTPLGPDEKAAFQEWNNLVVAENVTDTFDGPWLEMEIVPGV